MWPNDVTEKDLRIDYLCMRCNHDWDCHNTRNGNCATWMDYEEGTVCDCPKFVEETC